jgi:DNA-binding beta-propeller fold protein YncE
MQRLIWFVLTLSLTLAAQNGPKFEVDPSWPKPLPAGWINGQLGGVCVDSHDHVVVVDRRNITKEEKETSQAAPSILMFDAAGTMVRAWGDPNVVPDSIHGCAFDGENNVWVGGNHDGIIQKYSHDGKLLQQIGTRGQFDSADGTAKGKPLNAAHDKLYLPAGIAIDPGNGDLYVADGYGNRRIVVFDKNGKYLRQWGHQATKEETDSGAGAAFTELVHCVTMSKAGLIYVCDRQGDRIQVFDKMGKFQRNIWMRNGTPTLPDPRGTVWWLEFSHDQKYLYVMNGRSERVEVLDPESGKILSTFGRPGHQVGNFTHGHTMAIDSKGNLYVAETDYGRRVQRFKPVN